LGSATTDAAVYSPLINLTSAGADAPVDVFSAKIVMPKLPGVRSLH
jgi:hypothetical protein